MQLDLFSWDRVKVGEGFEHLARLDLKSAAAEFDEVLLSRQGHTEAALGQKMVGDWLDVLDDNWSVGGDDAAACLWNRLETYPFGPLGEEFRRVLIWKLIGIVKGKPDFYIRPALCLGRLYIEIGEYEKAEDALLPLLKKHPSDGRLFALLGNALLMQQRLGEARVAYAKGLLAAPREMEYMEDRELTTLIEDVGPCMAPIHGWFRGVLPLLDAAVESPQDQECEAALNLYGAMLGAEEARRTGDHAKMVESRRHLKRLSPDIFEGYMERMRNGGLL